MRASTSSVWPFPWTPATQTISPARTANETPSTATWSRSSRTTSPSTSSTGSPGRAGGFSTTSRTARPTIIEASSSSVVSPGVVVPTTRPRRRTVMRSATARTSLSLWVMKMMERPEALSWRITSKRSSVSWGVSTAVGSSRIRTLASR